MINSTTCFNSRLIWCLLLAALLFLLPACGKRRADEIDASLAQHPKYKELHDENKKLLQSLESLEDEVAKTKL